MNPFKRFWRYFTSKTLKQKICFVIVISSVLVLAFFMIKGNFFDPHISESGEGGQIEFRVNLIDMGVLLGVIIAYIVHKVREKIQQRRL